MKKILLVFSLIAGLTFNALAQQQDSKYKVSVGGDYLYAFGNATEFYDMGYGASIQGEYKLTSKLSATASASYIILGVNKTYKAIYSPWGVKLKNSTFYPAKAGLKYFLHSNFYAAAEAGASISKDQNVRATSFAYTAGLGTTFPISAKSSLDVGLKYDAWSLNKSDTYSFVGLRAAYAFGF